MAIDDYKVTNAEVQAAHVQAAPNTLTGTAQENKAVFDGYPELLKDKHNGLIDELDDALSEKADSSDVEAALAEKADIDDVDTALAGKVDKIEGKGLSANDYIDADKALVGTITNKVDKETGKGLSTNDYTTAEKMKLSGIAAGAEVNVQADWETNDTNSDAYIKNKPYIPNKTSDLTNDSNYATEEYVENGLDGKVDKETGKGLSANDYTSEEKALVETIPEMVGTISDKVDKETGKGLSSNDYTTAEKTKLAGIGDGAEANVQSDWSQTDTTADDYIKNKPPVPTKTSDLTNDSDFTVSDGTYDAMTVGMSKQLDTDEYEEDSVPYLFRKTGGTATAGDREVDKIVGGSVVFNQLVQNGNFVAKTAWQAINGIWETNNNIATFTRGSESYAPQFYQFVPVINGRKYFVTATVKPSVACRWDTRFEDIYTLRNATANEWLTISHICMATDTANYRVNIYSDISNERDTLQIKNVMCIDLTQMFGTDIADYVYQLEQSTAGSGIAWLKSLGFFTDDYYPYNAGEIKSVSGLSSHDMVGFNQWDEEWESGYYDTNGQPVSGSSSIRSKNYIKVVPNTVYHAKGTPLYVCQYDADKNFIGTRSDVSNGNFTTRTNARYIRFNMGGAYGTTYNDDICINISDTNRNGEYEPYIKHSYPLDNTLTLRGIPKITDGKLYYDGDVYNSDGSVVRKYGVVDLGSLNWSYQSAQTRFYTGELQGLIKPPYTVSEKPNCCCSSYKITSFNDFANSGDCAFGTTGNCFIMDSNYTDATAFKTAMQGVYLIYELAEPTTETAEPYSTIQVCDGAGTEEYVTTGIPVGHETKYPIDLKGKLEKIPLVEPPKTNGTYTLKCTVSGGVPSYSWV